MQSLPAVLMNCFYCLYCLYCRQVADQVMWWACTTPKAIEPLAEVMKLPNPLTMDSLTYMVSGRHVGAQQ